MLALKRLRSEWYSAIAKEHYNISLSFSGSIGRAVQIHPKLKLVLRRAASTLEGAEKSESAWQLAHTSTFSIRTNRSKLGMD